MLPCNAILSQFLVHLLSAISCYHATVIVQCVIFFHVDNCYVALLRCISIYIYQLWYGRGWHFINLQGQIHANVITTKQINNNTRLHDNLSFLPFTIILSSVFAIRNCHFTIILFLYSCILFLYYYTILILCLATIFFLMLAQSLYYMYILYIINICFFIRYCQLYYMYICCT